MAEARLMVLGWEINLGGMTRCVKEFLPEWGYEGDRSALERALPTVPEALPMVVGEMAEVGFSADSGTARHGEVQTSRVSSQRPLLKPEFWPTPRSTMELAIVSRLLGWNVLLQESDCCAFHALLRELTDICAGLQSHRCNHRPHPSDSALWQCQSCMFLCEQTSCSQLQSVAECIHCGHCEEFLPSEIPATKESL